MRQPWPPQSQNGFWYHFARVKFPKFLFLKPIPFSGRMIAQISIGIVKFSCFLSKPPLSSRIADRPVSPNGNADTGVPRASLPWRLAPLRGGGGLFSGCRLFGPRLDHRFFPALDGRGVPADMPHQLRGHPLRHQGLVDLLPQADLGKFPEGPRKGGLRGHIGPPHKTADAPKARRSPQGLNSGTGVGVVITALPTKARAKAWSSRGFGPNRRERRSKNFSIYTTAKMLTNRYSLSVNAGSQHSSSPGMKLRCNVPSNHDTVSLSLIDASLYFRFYS